MNATIDKIDKQVDWLKYLNTFILTLIFGFTLMCFTSINTVRNTQVEQGKELVRIKTIQDANTLSISVLNSRVTALEMNQADAIKNWVEANFVRRVEKDK
jgi:hypothetical protein